jgi:beta-lactamase regulating signal transducer with metallopeptidase domain
MLLFGAEDLAAATLILLAACALAARARSASHRHLVRLGGLLSLLLLPLFAILLPSQVVFSASPPLAMAAAPPHVSTHPIDWLLIGLPLLWLGGMLALLARGLAGAFRLRMLLSRGRPHDFDAASLAGWAARASYDSGWQLRLSQQIQSPLSWGIFHPVIMLPQACASWETARLDAAMLHELAHLRRRDALSQALVMLCSALYWPLPLVWLEAKRLRADAERAADDAVINSGIKQSDYAELLLSVASQITGRRFFAGLEFSMTGHGSLEARIQSVLAPHRSRSGVTKMQILKTALFGVATALALALARPTLGAEPQLAPLQLALAQGVTNATTPAGGEPLPAVTQSQLPPPSNGDASQSSNASPSAGTDEPKQAAAPEPRTDKALDEAHIGEAVARAISEAHIDQAVAKAMADAHIGEKIAAALAEAHIDQKIAEAIKTAQPQIDAAVARAQRQARRAASQHPTPQ